MVTADGCGCEGTPISNPCSVTTSDCKITVNGLNSSDYAKVFNSNWQIVWQCNPWADNCTSMEMITDLENGNYYVQSCGQTESVTNTGCGAIDPCADQGGDSDNDGVCNNQDCQPDNPNFPATPGSSCNDGNPNTENDVVSSDGCNCAGTPVQVCNPTRLAYWDLDACESFSSNGTNNDFSEFTASTSTPNGFSIVNASNLSHDDGSHSCTEGQSGFAICSGIRNSCSWSDNSDDAFKFSITVKPTNGGTATLTKLSFFERAPLTYSHISGNTGDNDPPSHYGFRVLKNGQEIYQKTGRNTTHDWTLEEFDLTGDPDFVFAGETTFEFELLGYCRSNGTSGLAVWDLDEIKVFGCAGDGFAPLESTSDEALYFNAIKNGRDVQLSWVTNTDYKNDYFEVEHSLDGNNFDLLEEVVSISDSENYMNYQNKDANAKVGVNYYRLKQYFKDGTYRYSEIREVAFDLDVNEFTIYPNPTDDQVFVNLKDFVGNAGVINIYNGLGQMVYSQKLEVIGDAPVRISTQDFSNGVHAVSVQIEDKKTMTELLMVIKR
ncbi:MAG: T9SS type A sorting domain-containing protein [Saprospiraceae bacterium]